MRGAASAGGGPALRDKLTLTQGVPVTIALQYSTGKRMQSRIPGAPEEMLYTLTDGRVLYLPLDVGKDIEGLRLNAREPFTVCKYGPRDWEVTRAAASAAAPLAQPAAVDRAQASRKGSAVGTTEGPDATLERALKTAILAASNAEAYAQSIGYPVRFDAEAIRSMAMTVLVAMDGGCR
jgi:hypothetical protein